MKTQNITLLAENETVPQNATVEQLVSLSDSTRFQIQHLRHRLIGLKVGITYSNRT
jgi:hypothetical protein